MTYAQNPNQQGPAGNDLEKYVNVDNALKVGQLATYVLPGGTAIGMGLEAIEGEVDRGRSGGKVNELAKSLGLSFTELKFMSPSVKDYLGEKDVGTLKKAGIYGASAGAGFAVSLLPIPFAGVAGFATTFAASYAADGMLRPKRDGLEVESIGAVNAMYEDARRGRGQMPPVTAGDVFLSAASQITEIQKQQIINAIGPDGQNNPSKMLAISRQYDYLVQPTAMALLGEDYNPDPSVPAAEQIAQAINQGRFPPAILLVSSYNIELVKRRLEQKYIMERNLGPSLYQVGAQDMHQGMGQHPDPNMHPAGVQQASIGIPHGMGNPAYAGAGGGVNASLPYNAGSIPGGRNNPR